MERAKTDLTSWLSGKGVSVPEGAKIDTLVGLLDALPDAGNGDSGGTSSPVSVLYGKVNFPEDTQTVNLAELTGKDPSYFDVKNTRWFFALCLMSGNYYKYDVGMLIYRSGPAVYSHGNRIVAYRVNAGSTSFNGNGNVTLSEGILTISGDYLMKANENRSWIFVEENAT